jgi:hypothetical protein
MSDLATTEWVLEHTLDGVPRSVRVEGIGEWGPSTVLLDHGTDLTASAPWAAEGFTVAPFLAPEPTANLASGMASLVRGLMAEAGIGTDDAFVLERYHHYVTTDEAHQLVVERFRKCLPVDRFPIDPRLVEDRVGQICGERLEIGSLGGVQLFCIRIIRPGSNDQNPIHRDGWLEHLRGCLNIYAPLGGSTALSSLGVIPGSHRWVEADICRTRSGAVVDGARFTVPALMASKRDLRLIRPNPSPDEVLVFSPFILHGGAPNLETDRTRVSLELRLVRAAAPG